MKDKFFKIILFFSATIALLLIVGIFYSLVIQSIPSIKHFGFLNFLMNSNWNSQDGNESYGAFVFMIGSILTALIAVIISIPFSVSLSIWCVEYFAKTKFALWVTNMIQILTKIPSIIFGIWGYFILRPLFISLHIGNLGMSILLTFSILAIMIIPLITSYCIYYGTKIPISLKEAAYSLGATQMEVINKICFPYIKKGIIASYLLALGKVLGETMIIVILLGNNNHTVPGLIDNVHTLSSLLLLEIGTSSQLEYSSLFLIGLLLFLLTGTVNLIAKYLLRRVNL